MTNFKELLLWDEKSFKNKLSEIDSSVLINYLRNCNDKNIKNEYYKRIENILGKYYLNLLKKSVNYKGKIILNMLLIKYSLLLFSTFISCLMCVFIFLIISKTPLDYYINGLFYEIDILLMMGFLFSIFPQIILYIILYFFNKIMKINKIIEVIIVIVLGVIMSFSFLSMFSRGNTISIKEYIIFGYYIYLPIIISGIIYRILLFKINKIKIREKYNDIRPNFA
jgi:hypothetical protein